MRNVYTLIFFITLISSVNGQNGRYFWDEYKYYVPSPQTSDFIQYGNLPVTHNTGSLDLQIPIYNYKDKDFKLDLSLSYNSSGFVPNKRSNTVGLNWFLNGGGGCITRKIVGVPDDKLVNLKFNLEAGLYNGLKRYSENYQSSEIFNFNQGAESIHIYWFLGGTSPYVETESDIYSFNAMGHSGKFMIDFDKQAKVFGTNDDKAYKIDLSGMSNQDENEDHPNPSEIIITSGDGYIYKFGGSPTYLEYLTGDITSDEASKFYNPTIVSWYLREIIAPSGRKVTFYYRSFDPGYNHVSDQPRDTCHYLLNIYPLSFTSMYEEYNSDDVWFLINVSHSVSEGYSERSDIMKALKTVYVEKIVVDNDCEIAFSYSGKGKKFYQQAYGTPISYFNQRNLKLDLITISSPTGPVKKVYFTYSYKGNTGKERLFLDKFQIEGQEPYLFEYYTGNFPSPKTHGLDYWGYWNGIDNEDAELIPQFNLQTNGDITYTSGEREPNINSGVFNLGLLSKVTYPTKSGNTIIEYEPHRYSKVLDRRSGNDFLPLLYDVNQLYAGGARVRKVKDQDGSSIYNEREFFYTQSYSPGNPGTGNSSGILLYWPRYVYAWQGDLFPGEGYRNFIKIDNVGVSVSAFDDEYITYSRVIEKRSDNSYSVFDYSNYQTNPDDFSQNQRNNPIYDPGLATNPYNFYINIYRMPNDRSYERGKLIKRVDYSADGNPSFSKSYNYQRIGNEQFVASVITSGDKFFSIKNYVHSYLLKSDTTKTYSMNLNGTYNSTFISEINNYEYGDYDLLTKRQTTDSDGKSFETRYQYPADYYGTLVDPNDSTTATFYNMVAKNMLNVPIERTNLRDDEVIRSELYLYKTENGLVVPDEYYKLSSVSQLDWIFGTSYMLLGFFHKSDNYQLEEQYLKYDSTGNLREQLSRNGITTSYLWDATQNYLKAKIEGATYSSISSQEGKPADYDSKTLRDNLNDLVPNAQISTYSYSPLWGITSQSNANGVTSYYSYDPYGRLTLEKDDDFAVTDQYKYHYGGPLSANPSILNFSNSGGWLSVSVSSNLSWTVSDNQSWITVSPGSGSNNGTLSVTCSANTGTTTRTGIITLTGGGTSGTITVIQKGVPNLNVSPTSLSFSSGTSTKTFTVSSNLFWTVSANQTWITVSPVLGTDNGTVSVTCSANRVTSSRSGTVTISGGGITRTVAITQAASSNQLTVSPDSLAFDESGGTQTFSIISNISWTVTDNSSWITVNPSSGSDDQTISVTCLANGSVPRNNGIVTISGGGITRTIAITQEATQVQFNVSPTSFTFSASGGHATCEITSNYFWWIREIGFMDWNYLNATRGGGSYILEIDCPANPGPSTRTGGLVITETRPDGTSSSITVNVTQYGN
jgi:YD repeat-containing protein